MGDCRPTDFLTLDVEQDMTRLFQMEIIMHKESENLKQRFESHMDYTPQASYNCVDNAAIGFIDIKGFDNFFKRLFSKGIELEAN